MKKLMGIIQKKFMRSLENNINYATMRKMLQENNNIIVIDIRPRDEYATKHLTGAINIPLHEIDEKIKYMVRQKSSVIIVYCKHGARSKKAVAKLQKLGYENVYNLSIM